MNVLVVDVGGTHVKILASGQEERREFPSGPALTAEQMVRGVKELAGDWKYDAVSIGYPGPVLHGQPALEPHNLGPGWVGFDYGAAFGCQVKIINDAAMQALGSYQGGKMLFLGQKKWRQHVVDMVAKLITTLEPDDVVLGGGNVKKLKELPPRCRAGDNANAFLGGFRLWEKKRQI